MADQLIGGPELRETAAGHGEDFRHAHKYYEDALKRQRNNNHCLGVLVQ